MRPERAEDLHLLVAHRVGGERDRRLHRREAEELHQVVLDDVLRDAGLLEELAAPLDADLLGDGDLHVVDVLAVPERLEEAVREAEDEEVLDRLLAEVVIDAEDLRLGERAARCESFSSRALARSWPNGFSMMTRVQGPPVRSAAASATSAGVLAGSR